MRIAVTIALQAVGRFIDANDLRIRKPRSQILGAITSAAARIQNQGFGRCLDRIMYSRESLGRMGRHGTQPGRDQVFVYHPWQILMHVLLW